MYKATYKTYLCGLHNNNIKLNNSYNSNSNKLNNIINKY